MNLERIDERARRRRRKDREERRRDLEIQRAEDAKWGRTKSQPIVRLDSQVHFPGFSPSSLEQDMPKMSEDVFQAESPSSLEYAEQQSGGPSFAQVENFKVKLPTCAYSLVFDRCYVKGRTKFPLLGLHYPEKNLQGIIPIQRRLPQ